MFPFPLIILLGTIIRFLLVGNPGFVADIAFWKSWSLSALDAGIVATTHQTNINYPPGFIYVLWVMGWIYTLFGNPHDYNTFWRENNFAFLFASKSIAMAADLVIAGLLSWFLRQKGKLARLGAKTGENLANGQASLIGIINRNLPLALPAIFLFNPVVIIDSALWGQVESFGLMFTLLAIVLIFYKKPNLATFIFTIGVLMKLQNIIYIPLVFLFIWRYFDFKTMVKSLGTAALGFFLVCLPFILAHDMKQVLYLLTVNNDYFPWMSLNAHNLWWIKAGGHGMDMIDKITILGILNAKNVGLFLFSAFYLLCCLLILLRPTPRNFILSLTIAVFAFFLLTTQSHERYSYPVLVLLLFLYPFIQEEKLFSKKTAWTGNFFFWLLYLFLTIAIFFNVHTGLIFNYPYNGFQPLTAVTTTPLTLLNSYLLIFLFLLLLPFVFSQIPVIWGLGCLGFLALLLLFGNLSYLSGKISLTTLKPVLAKQDYGSLQTDRSVNSYSGWKSWSRLSSSYLYYRKGFGTHANSNLVFDIDKKFSVFQTDFGIDTEAGTQASVIFKIFGDEKLLFESRKMGRFDFPGHTNINVAGVKYLGLVVEDAGDGINNDHADWFNPTLYK